MRKLLARLLLGKPHQFYHVYKKEPTEKDGYLNSEFLFTAVGKENFKEELKKRNLSAKNVIIIHQFVRH